MEVFLLLLVPALIGAYAVFRVGRHGLPRRDGQRRGASLWLVFGIPFLAVGVLLWPPSFMKLVLASQAGGLAVLLVVSVNALGAFPGAIESFGRSRGLRVEGGRSILRASWGLSGRVEGAVVEMLVRVMNIGSIIKVRVALPDAGLEPLSFGIEPLRRETVRHEGSSVVVVYKPQWPSELELSHALELALGEFGHSRPVRRSA